MRCTCLLLTQSGHWGRKVLAFKPCIRWALRGQMKRREFITLFGGAAATWPFAVRAQQPTPVVGFLHTRSPDDTVLQVAAFRRGLAENGYVEGQSVTIEYRFARGEYDQLPALAAELVRRQVAVLVAVGGDPAALAAKSATSTIPIVFAVGSDPVELGLVASYKRPGGNATGMNVLTATLEAKRLGLIHELVPQAATIGFLTNPRFASAEGQVHDVQEAARALALKVRVLPASTEKDIVAAFGTISGENILALAVGSDHFSIRARGDHRSGGTLFRTHNIPVSRTRGGRWPDELRDRYCGRISPDWRSSRSDSQRRESGGPAGPAANQVRVCHQSQDRQGAGPRRIPIAPATRRRGD